MKDFKNIFVTQLDIQEKHFGKKKSLENCNSFQIMAVLKTLFWMLRRGRYTS